MSSVAPREDGFEYDGNFFTWSVTDVGKDLMLIDRISGLGMAEFFEAIEDVDERGRSPIMLTLIATSIRAHFPSWSVERIYRTVMNLKLSDVALINADDEQVDEDAPMLPPPSPTTSNDASARSQNNGSSSSSTPADDSTSETSYATPA